MGRVRRVDVGGMIYTNAGAPKRVPDTVLLRFDSGFRRWLLAVLRTGALGLAVSAGIAFQFPVLICDAQTSNCSGNSIPPDEAPQYFPTGVFSVRGPFMASWCSCFLRAMGERPLTGPRAASASTTYRLLVVPPWRPPFIVRLDIQTDGSGILVRKEARHQADAGTLTVDTSQAVSREEVEVFDSLLTKADFWSMPTILMWASHPRMPVMVLDGVVWVLEGAKPGSYHVVSRALPNTLMPAGPYTELSSYLFKDLAHFEVPPVPAIPSKRKR